MTISTILRNVTLVAVLTGTSLTAACKKSGSDCDAVFDHIVSIAPAEAQAKMKAERDASIGRCEKLKPEARQCALDAKDLGDLMKCPRE
jgi:hypothetical protein